MKLIITEAQAAYIIKEGEGKTLNAVGSKLGDWGSRMTGKAKEKAADVVGNVGPDVAGWASKQQMDNMPSGMSDKIAARFDDIDIERDAPNLHKFASSWKEVGDVEGVRQMVKPGADPENVEPPTIPKKGEMMLPLGRKVKIDSKFGPRNIKSEPRASKNHQGVDLDARSGSPVYAPLSGVVTRSGDTTPDPCGGYVRVRHNKKLETKFCHLKQWAVKVGEKVKKGDVLGYTGGGKDDPYRGVSTGPHLHYAIVVDGKHVDPLTIQPNLV